MIRVAVQYQISCARGSIADSEVLIVHGEMPAVANMSFVPAESAQHEMILGPMQLRMSSPSNIETILSKYLEERNWRPQIGDVLFIVCASKKIYGRFGCPSLSIAPSAPVRLEISVQNVEPINLAMYNVNHEEIVRTVDSLKESGNAEIKENNPRKAREHYVRAIQLIEETSARLNVLSNANLLSSDDCVEMSHDFTARFSLCHNNLAHCEFALQRPGLALLSCAIVLSCDNSNAKAHYRVASVYEKCGYFAEAYWHCARSNALSPQTATTRKAHALKELDEKEKQTARTKRFEAMFSRSVARDDMSIEGKPRRKI